MAPKILLSAAALVTFCSFGLVSAQGRTTGNSTRTNTTLFEDNSIDSTRYNFKGVATLGYAINIGLIDPFDADSIHTARRTGKRIFQLTQSGKSTNNLNGTMLSTAWNVPDNVLCDSEAKEDKGKLVTYSTGSDASQAFSADASLAARYEVVSGELDVSGGVQKAFHSQLQYGLYDFNRHTSDCSFDEWTSAIDQGWLSIQVNRYLTPWNEKDTNVVKQYRNFFNDIGTHVVTAVHLGGRFALSTWASNQNTDFNANFSADVKAKYDEVIQSGDVDVSIKGSEQYKNFDSAVQYNVDCKGGDSGICGPLEKSPSAAGGRSAYAQWTTSVDASPDLISVETVAIDTVVRQLDDNPARGMAQDIQDAYNWVVRNPLIHRTKFRMLISSDWAEVRTSSPSAYFAAVTDTGFVMPADSSVEFSMVQWHPKNPYQFQRQLEIDFYVLNQGEQIELLISHGNDAVTPGDGKGSVIVTSSTKSVTSDNQNQKFDFQADTYILTNGPKLQDANLANLGSTYTQGYNDTQLTGTVSSSGASPSTTATSRQPFLNPNQPGGSIISAKRNKNRRRGGFE